MTLNGTKQEPFGFWIVREFLEPEETAEEEYISSQFVLLAGCVLFVIIVLVGLFTPGHS